MDMLPPAMDMDILLLATDKDMLLPDLPMVDMLLLTHSITTGTEVCLGGGGGGPDSPQNNNFFYSFSIINFNIVKYFKSFKLNLHAFTV